MAKRIKLKDSTFWDSSSIVHGTTSLETKLNKIDTADFHTSKGYDTIEEFLDDFKTFAGYKVHVGYLTIAGANGYFIGYLQTYLGGYGKVHVFTSFHTHMAVLDNGTWTKVSLNNEQYRNALTNITNDWRDTGWKNITSFNNGAGFWSSNHTPPRYRRIGNQVYLEGLFSFGTNERPQFVLPVGYRPSKPYASFLQRCGNGYCIIYINDADIDGNVVIQSITRTNSSKETSLFGITYETDDAWPS